MKFACLNQRQKKTERKVLCSPKGKGREVGVEACGFENDRERVVTYHCQKNSGNLLLTEEQWQLTAGRRTVATYCWQKNSGNLLLAEE